MLTQQYAPTASPPAMAAILQVETGLSPCIIDVADGRLVRPPNHILAAPSNADEAISRNSVKPSFGTSPNASVLLKPSTGSDAVRLQPARPASSHTPEQSAITPQAPAGAVKSQPSTIVF